MKNNSYRFGCMLRFNLFTDSPSEESIRLCEAFGGKQALLEFCGMELNTVELHTVKSDSNPADVLNAVNELRSYGLSATIHGAIAEKDNFFAPYRELFASGIQPLYNITVHPASNEADTESMLKDICDEIEKRRYPTFITLENQRMKSEEYFGVCCDVARIVKNIGSKHLGVCFDFGHQLSNERKYNKDSFDIGFVKQVRHTHIHSLFEGRTHFPLDKGEIALERNLTALFESGFDGVLSLELAPDRYMDRLDIKDALISSVRILKNALSCTLSKRQNEYKN